MPFLRPLFESLERLLLGGRHYFRIELLAAGRARARGAESYRIRRDVVGFIFSILHRGPLSRASASHLRTGRVRSAEPSSILQRTVLKALFIGKLKLRASAQS